MKSELAEELLQRLMGWDEVAFQARVRELEALATVKYDEYGNYRPGVKFFESLAAWLDQLENSERATAMNFVFRHLIYVSDAELTHLVELTYPDHIESVLLRRVSQDCGTEIHRVAHLLGTDQFRALLRRSLILGVSDGARLDRLRRSAPVLSHEQFLQSSEPQVDVVGPMREKLEAALEEKGLCFPATFCHIFVVDDFSGSGMTMLRRESEELKGKLWKLKSSLPALLEAELIPEDFELTIVLYLASEQARDHIKQMLQEVGLEPWELRITQLIPNRFRIDQTDPEMVDLCRKYYDPVLGDEHKGDAPIGYADCALPLVLSHNTPNNSACLLWADTTDEAGGLGREALFPRYERHHRSRQ